MQGWLNGKLVIGLAALALAALAGGAFAATESSGPSTRQAFLNDVAKRLHVTPQQLRSALNGATIDQLQAAVKAGRLTQAQANALEQRLKQNGTLPPVPFGLFGPPGGVAPRFRVYPGPFGGPGALASAASYLGLTVPQLFHQLSGGKSLAQIAAAKGKPVSGLERAMTVSVKSRLDKLLAAKAITSAQEQRLLSRLKARISQEVNQNGLRFPRSIPPRLRFNRGVMPAPPRFAYPPLGA